MKIVIEKAFPKELVHVELGDKDVAAELFEHPFDHVFFTGSTPVGKKVMEQASRHLASVTLELGGKSPALVDATANIRLAAHKLIFGKMLNRGQSCVAPDWCFVEKSIWPQLKSELQTQLTQLNLAPHMTSLVSEKHGERIERLHQEALAKGWSLEVKTPDSQDVRRPPLRVYLMQNPQLAAHTEIISDEIFGPLLPVILFDSLDEVIARLQRAPKPLALYLFSESNETQAKVSRQLSSGGLVINDVMIQLLNPHLPFGGIGPSGLGDYHGENGFWAFSHRKSILKRHHLGFLTRYLLPPHPRWLIKLVKKVSRWG